MTRPNTQAPKSATIDMAFADCDQPGVGLTFDFGSAKAHLPGLALLSTQYPVGKRDFLDCHGVYWDTLYSEWSKDDRCDDGRLGPDFMWAWPRGASRRRRGSGQPASSSPRRRGRGPGLDRH